MDIFNMTAVSIGQKIKNRELGVLEVTKEFFKNVSNKSNGYICFTENYAYKKAKEIQKRIDNRENLSILAGVPISIKDNICTRDIKTTCASKMLENYIPTYNATVFEKLEKEGMILVGKLNMDEFAMGDKGKTSFFGECKNPWDNLKSTGGSSSGCASAIAYKEAICTLGSDTGGSIRQPASFCSTTGIKPTYGLVSRYGLIGFSPQFDQIGPITKDALDCKNILEIISGYDKYDITTIKAKNYKWSTKIDTIKSFKIGICKNFVENSEKDVQNIFFEAVEVFKKMGATIEEIDLDILEYSMPAYQALSSVSAMSNMARYDGIKYGHRPKNINESEEICITSRTEAFGTEVKKRIMLGNFILSSDNNIEKIYNKALNAEKYIKNEIKKSFQKYDILLTPTTPKTAVSFDDETTTDIFLVGINIAGVPAISIPCGFTKNNMPIGVQLIGDYFKDNLILNMAIEFQKNTDFHLKTPF